MCDRRLRKGKRLMSGTSRKRRLKDSGGLSRSSSLSSSTGSRSMVLGRSKRLRRRPMIAKQQETGK